MKSLDRLTYWYFSKKALPYWVILALDCAIIILSGMFTYTLNHGGLNTLNHFWPLMGTIACYTLLYIPGFKLFHTYDGIIRYSSFVDLQRVAAAVTMGMLISMAVCLIPWVDETLIPVDLRDVGIWSVLSLMVMWLMRVTVKFMYDTMFKRKDAKRAFIYGIKEGGISIAKSIRNQDPSDYVVAGFVADSESIDAHTLMGVNIYPLNDTLVDKMKEDNIKALFVSPLRSEALRENPDFVNAVIAEGIKIFMVPTEKEWDGHSDINHSMLREVDIEDLLPREKIEVDLNAIEKILKDTVVLITGAAGSIGSEIVRQVAQFKPKSLVLIDQAETPLHDIRLMMAKEFPDVDSHTIIGDIANERQMEDIFRAHRPQYVFHAAAYKHVPMMEDNPYESIDNNVKGTVIIADMAVKYGTDKFVMISTDKAVNPTNVMGCSKRICEIYVQSLDRAIEKGQVKGSTHFITTRFGNVLGSNGSVIPLFKEQIKKGGPVTVTHPDIIRYFMLIPEACKLVLEAGTLGHGGDIFVFDMGKPVKIVELAKRMIRLSGVDIEIKFTGLRDGEKLYEEVLNDEEITLPTFHPKIKIAKVREYDYAEADRVIRELIEAAPYETDMEIVARMKAIVPEFRSRHSKYEVLDKPQPTE